MGLINLPKKDTTAPAPKPSGEFPNSDFVPYAIFFNEHTILSKNGELIQTIKIPLNAHGLPNENAENTGVYLRDLLRQMAQKHLSGHQVSHWTHVFRERETIAPLGEPELAFANTLQSNWLGAQRTSYSYHNVCYLTVVIQGQSADLFNMDEFRKAGKKRKNRNYRQDYLAAQAEMLEQTMQQLMADIAVHFKLERLGFEQRQEGGSELFFSTQLEWLYRLVNLREAPLAINELDLGQQLDQAELIFGFDALESRQGKQKRFASVLSLKHYHELPVELFDRFLQMPVEMVITQASHPISNKNALDEVKEIGDVLKHSQDGFIAQASGFIDVLNASAEDGCGFASQQTTIMIITDDYKDLDPLTNDLQTAISKIGLLCVREDIKMEEVFWSQLPANFEFIRRAQPIPMNKLDGLARLNYYPTGQRQGYWGEPITILPTATRTPYLFHFHRGEVGHTALYDFNSFPDALGYRLVHFLASAASKQTKRTIMFDRHGVGELFVGAMKGTYSRLGGKQHNLSLNPLAMECIPGNQGFLAAWLALLLEVGPEDTAAREAIRTCISQGWDASNAQEGFAQLVHMMQPIHEGMALKLRELMHRPAFGACFATGLDNLNLDADFSAINIHSDAISEGSAVAIFSLLLHRTILMLDGEPTLIVIKDAWDVLDHPFFISRLKSLMDMLTERNASLLITTRHPEDLPTSAITPIIAENVATTLVIPDDVPCDYMPELLGYHQTEAATLAKMERQKGAFLVVHGAEVISTKLIIKDATQQALLSGDTKTLQAIRNA